MKYVMSIQGGGIRGILPACALIELEKQLGKSVASVFDFVGGTSTGAALTACIVAGMPMTKALEFYTTEGPKVFAPVSPLLRYANLLARGRMFDSKVLHGVMVNALSSASSMTVNDSHIGIMVTAAAQDKHIWYFVKDASTNAGTTGKASLVDAAVASCCATTYHDPWLIPGYGYFSDGGTVGLADPVYETMVEAFSGSQCYGHISPTDATVISLGTGYYSSGSVPSPPDGLLDRIEWVTGSLVDSSKTLAQQAADRQWPGLVQVLNPAIWADVDEADVSDIPSLLALGRKWAATINWKKVLNGSI